MPEAYAWECLACKVGGELIARNERGEEVSRHIPNQCPLCYGRVKGISHEEYEDKYGEEE